MARRLLGLAIATAMVLLPNAASAQKGQQIFDFLLQQADREIQRQQQQELHRNQQQELSRLRQQFVVQWQACHRDDLDACDRALDYSYLGANDRQALLRKRAAIINAQHEATERVRRERIEAEFEERQRQLAEQAERIEHERRAAAEAEIQLALARAAQTRTEPVSQIITGALPSASSPAPATIAIAVLLLAIFVFCDATTIRAWYARVPRLTFASGASAPRAAATISGIAEPTAASVAERSPVAVVVTASPAPRDTIGAIAALELAHAYLDEVRVADTPAFDDKDGRKHQLNSLSLAARQLDAAGRLDPDAVLEGELPDGTPFCFSINELKAEALLLEGLTHQIYDTKRALPALVAATKLNPNHPNAFFVLGLTHAANRNKAASVAALQRAVALDPKNITYRKELNRVESLSGAEIAAYRATRAGEKIYDASVLSWNIFAVVWNITTFPLRVVVGIFRMLGLTGFR